MRTEPRPRRPEQGAEEFLPPAPKRSLAQLRDAAATCQGCDLYKNATQTVFGEGSKSAVIVLVGEQPGDREDIEGHPFVGPAGAMLDRAFAEAGIARKEVYITNAVKHFKWTAGERGKKRLHSKPSARQMKACRPWLEAELAAIRPQVLVLLGASAAQSLLGPAFRITKERGTLIEGTTWAPYVTATLHPSAILRAPEQEDRRRFYAQLVEDLRTVARAAHQ